MARNQILPIRQREKGEKGESFDTNQNSSKPMSSDVQIIDCDRCGEEVPLWNGLVNTCRECGQDYSGTGQRLRNGHNTRSRLAQERGRDPGVGRPGY
jgi:hypothetical protein